MDIFFRKPVISAALQRKCLDCKGDSAAVYACNGKKLGIKCSLWPYRNPGIRKMNPDGSMRSVFYKGAVLRAIRQACRSCCGENDPERACPGSMCALTPYVEKSASREAMSGGATDLGQVAKVTVPPPMPPIS